MFGHLLLRSNNKHKRTLLIRNISIWEYFRTLRNSKKVHYYKGYELKYVYDCNVTNRISVHMPNNNNNNNEQEHWYNQRQNIELILRFALFTINLKVLKLQFVETLCVCGLPCYMQYIEYY